MPKIKISRIVSVALQAVVWLSFLLLPFGGSPPTAIKLPVFPPSDVLLNSQFSINWLIILSNAATIGVFYVNYYYLIPRVLHRKGWKIYAATSLLFLLIYLSLHFGFTNIFLKELNYFIPPPLRIFPFVFIFFVSLALRLAVDRTTEERQRKERENENLKSELSFLRSQISPHFLFNVMNNLVALSRVNPKLVEPTLIKLSQLMRYMLYDSDESQVTLDREIDYLDSYIELQKLRFGDSVAVFFDKNINYTEGSHLIEPMLLIPFVENAFKHGISFRQLPEIRIKLSVTHNVLTLNVLNQFHTESTEQKDADSGIGLRNVSRRLALLYGENHTLKAEPIGDFFEVNLKINLKN